MGSIDAGHSKTRIQRAKESVIGLVSELSRPMRSRRCKP